MIRFPRRHLADSTVARIHTAAQRVKERSAPELEPGDEELIPMLPPARKQPTAATPPAGQAPPTAPAGLPPLDQSGLNVGATLNGADAFDSMLGAMDQ